MSVFNSTRIILHGAKAVQEGLRGIIERANERSPLEVRLTWEAKDIKRFVAEASSDGCKRIIFAGGDGTLKEGAKALMSLAKKDRPEMAILPMGTANDFARANDIPVDLAEALALAQTAKAFSVDCVKANDEFFINVASGGFGAEVTASTPEALKKLMGGGAYTIAGLVKAVTFAPYQGVISCDSFKESGEFLFAAVGNGRQAGGGLSLCSEAMINDGKFDLVIIKSFLPEAITEVLAELSNVGPDGEYVKYVKTGWAEWDFGGKMPLNLDGEPLGDTQVKFELIEGAIDLALPESSPLLVKS